jgi:glutamine synthetase
MQHETKHQVDPAAAALASERLRDCGAQRVLVGGCDINGIFRAKFVPGDRFIADPAAAVHFADVFAIMDVQDDFMPRPDGFTGWWPTWDEGFGDLEAIPDLGTITPAPWLDGSAIVLCDYVDLTGKPLEAMPRNVLGRVVAAVESAGLRPMMAPELEFMLFRETADTAAEKGYRDLAPVVARPSAYGGARVASELGMLAPIEKALDQSGIVLEATMAEAGPGQYELNLTPHDALRAADEAFLFKFIVKQVAEQNGLLASFFPKFSAGGFGSSFHVHQSLWDNEGRNVFYDRAEPDGLSTTARQYIAGLVACAREFTAVFAPFVTSYKRFEPESAAGSALTWSVQSKSVAIRAVPAGGSGTRVEHRTPGADANPYLTLAAMIAAGHWGIENDLDPGSPYQGNAYADPTIAVPPTSMEEAIELFEQSEVANKAFGEAAVAYYAATRRWEWEQFRAAFTDWEFRRYLPVV